jgi:hypothetical protein
MATETNLIQIAETVSPEALAIATALRPSPTEIDELATRYNNAKVAKIAATTAFSDIELEAIELVKNWGIVVPRAEKSRRLTGILSVFTVTKADTLTINDDRVETLKEALEANGHGAYFAKLFTLRSKYEIVEGAEAALKSESLPKRLSEKVLNLFGRCIGVTPKKPFLKVVVIDPAKPAKKATKAKKGGAK